MASLSLVFDILARDKASKEFDKVSKAAARAGDSVDKTKKKTDRIGDGLKTAAAGVAGAAVVRFFSDSAGAASRAEQSVGGVQAVFKGYASQIEASAKTAATSLGLSESAYREMTTTLGAGLKNKGIKDFGDQSQKLVKIGADLSAQFGGSTQEAVEALASAMRGEMDPIEKYGVSLNEAAVAAEAASMGLVKTVVDSEKVKQSRLKVVLAQRAYNDALKEHGKNSDEALTAESRLASAQTVLGKAMEGKPEKLTAQQKAMASLSLVTKQTSDASGAFGREQDTLAGKQARAGAQWENLQKTVGEKFLPVLAGVMGLISDNIPTLVALAAGIAAVGVVVVSVSAATKVWNSVQAISKAATLAWDGINKAWTATTKAMTGASIGQKVATIASTAASKVAMVATKAWAAAQWLMNAALSANPIGLVIALVAGLAAGLVIAYQKSETFRDIVNGAWKAVQTGASFMWNNVLKPIFKTLVDKFLGVAESIVQGAATAFGWVPGIGPKLREAADKFSQFRKDVNKSLDGIEDEGVNVGVGFYVKKSGYKSKTPVLDLVKGMGDGHGLDSYGRGIGDGLGLDVKRPSLSSMRSTARSGMLQHASTSSQLMSLLEDSTAGVGASGARGWQAMWAAVKGALPGATLNSSFRPGAITATGNRSYHGMGRAIDIGPATMKTFRTAKALFPNATELIFSPAGNQQLWHGKPHMYSGVTRANHWDHVHLAMQTGGKVPGYGRGDRIPALLEPGEYVVRRQVVEQTGVANMDRLNAGVGGGGSVTNNIYGVRYDLTGDLDRALRYAEAERSARKFATI